MHSGWQTTLLHTYVPMSEVPGGPGHAVDHRSGQSRSNSPTLRTQFEKPTAEPSKRLLKVEN